MKNSRGDLEGKGINKLPRIAEIARNSTSKPWRKGEKPSRNSSKPKRGN
jgi:hypothetical protein